MMGIGVIIGFRYFRVDWCGCRSVCRAGHHAVVCVFRHRLYFCRAGLCRAGLSRAGGGQRLHYTYASIGELLAWLVGWNLVLEYSVGAAAVAGGRSAYTVGLLKSAGLHVPPMLTAVYG